MSVVYLPTEHSSEATIITSCLLRLVDNRPFPLLRHMRKEARSTSLLPLLKQPGTQHVKPPLPPRFMHFCIKASHSSTMDLGLAEAKHSSLSAANSVDYTFIISRPRVFKKTRQIAFVVIFSVLSSLLFITSK